MICPNCGFEDEGWPALCEDDIQWWGDCPECTETPTPTHYGQPVGRVERDAIIRAIRAQQSAVHFG